MNYKNIIATIDREYINADSAEYFYLYNEIADISIKTVFSKLHSEYIRLFRMMNQRLPTHDNTEHYWAEESRYLLDIIESTNQLIRVMKNTEYAFGIEKEYEQIINNCNKFLTRSGGSTIPENTEKIELYYEQPIFVLDDTVKIERTGIEEVSKRENLKPVGEGSYAKVFKYKDSFYNKNFILKRANKNLNEKEIDRFKKEYEILKELNSPYIIEVYNFDNNRNEYVMEYAEYTLKNYLEKYPDLDMKYRQNIGLQIIKGLEYLHIKGHFHRDLSITNILIKNYESIPVVKLSDFGLVKTMDSTLTSLETELKGSLNDPALKHVGFKNYNILHEIYSLTLLLNYVVTGRININNESKITKSFVATGTNVDGNKRFQNLKEVKEAFLDITNKNKKQESNVLNLVLDKRDVDIYSIQKKHLARLKENIISITNNDFKIYDDTMIDIETYLNMYGDNDPVKTYRDKDLKHMHNVLIKNLKSFIKLIENNKKYNANKTFKFRPYDENKNKLFLEYAGEIINSYNFIVGRLEEYI